ncbi:MAG: tetratricopeptide repeat-containing glycosyltransferase family protein [Parvibaculum sp.]|uniref:tetratricopeptide repeat-containing glycosyltransferase family protein n=1 Tax=Parvibaculum sp. TaxID=2024848 RepID=UPI0032EC0668
MSALKKQRVAENDEIEKKFAQGQRLQARERFADAEQRFRKVLALDPRHLGALAGLTQCLIAQKKQQEAIATLDRAAADAPAGDEVWLFELAGICATVKYLHQARTLYERALEIAPDMSSSLINLANVVEEQGDLQKSIDLLSRAIEVHPASARAYGNLGKVLTGTHLRDEALACYRRSIELNPNISQTWTNLAALYEIMGLHHKAMSALQQALNLDADCDAARWNLARSLLTVGEIEAGWDMYGFGFSCRERKPYRPFPGLIWEGQDLTDKTIMVWREQGLGDDLLFSTCYTDLIARAGHVIIETERRLVSLYQRTWPQATVRAETWTSTGLENYGPVDFDYTAPAGLVAARLRRGLADFARPRPTLQPDPARIADCRAWLNSLGPGPKIGISWTSSKVNDVRSLSYTKLADWKDLFAIEGAAVVNLQYTDVSEEAEALRREHGLTLQRMPGLNLRDDLEGVAALTACMDAVVAPSSFPMMMAGALGRPAFHYIRRNWTMLGTDGSPWFPQMRCYLIDDTGTNSGFVKRIATDLRAFLQV